MALAIPRELVEFFLLGPTRDRRQLQDSPILGDVWIAFAQQPAAALELLITPEWSYTAAEVAASLDDLLAEDRARRKSNHPPSNIASLQGIVAARLFFDEVLGVAVPMTDWWTRFSGEADVQQYLTPKTAAARLETAWEYLLALVNLWALPGTPLKRGNLPSSLDRYAALAGLIMWAAKQPEGPAQPGQPFVDAVTKGKKDIIEELNGVLAGWRAAERRWRGPRDKGPIFHISMNRAATMAISKSVPAVKADAALTLFSVDCSKIAWAVVDSGINARHPSFLSADGKQSRVKGIFDFSRYRSVVSLDNLRIFAKGADSKVKNERLKRVLTEDLLDPPGAKEAGERLEALAQDLKSGRLLHWDNVLPFVQLKPESMPDSDHGTHVAGIIGARRPPSAKSIAKDDDLADYANGMCPDIQLYDFRVTAQEASDADTEFAVIAALQYIRHLNEQRGYTMIHGANLSLSIPHDVRNYACGYTPICLECERLVESGVVVVAAAGNLGYQKYQTREGLYEGYAAFSLTDPGNADGVITVGSTHRTSPHTYGVSFFSSRGPTGDGRAKPDLVAPGERIHAPFRDRWGDLDGTSMAAPHVSGAAAMLLGRYSELIGQPRRIKRILCESATDLGRERSFQGNGMLDVLRAFQSI